MYKPGDYFVYCGLSGQKALRSDCIEQWDGLIVKKEYAEMRHPLDLQKPLPKEAVPHETRPEPTDSFLNYGDVTRNSY